MYTYLHHFVVSSLARAHLFVAWVLCMPANISNGSRVNLDGVGRVRACKWKGNNRKED